MNNGYAVKVRTWVRNITLAHINPKFEEDCLIASAVISKQILSKGGWYIKSINYMSQKCQDTLAIGTHYTKRWEGVVGSFIRLDIF